MKPNQPNNWDVVETAGVINARNRVTLEVFAGTRAEFNAKLASTEDQIPIVKFVGSTQPANNFDGEPDGCVHFQVLL